MAVMLEQLKRMMFGPSLPPETRKAIERAATYRDLLEALDRVCTANEVRLRELEREAEKLEAVEHAETDALRETDLSERGKRVILQRIQRLRKQIQIVDDKIDIHAKNVDLHQNLMGKIQRIESMTMQAVGDDLITELISDFEENFVKYKEVLRTGEAADVQTQSPLTSKDRAELRKLEEELLGKPPAKEKEKMPVPARTEKVAEPAAREIELE